MRILLLPLVFAFALAMRIFPLPLVLTEEGVFPGSLFDEFYHLRRIVYSVLRFPDVLSFDPYVNHPDGGQIHWPAGFDWGAAALVRLWAGADDVAAVEAAAVWVPALLGALAVAGAAWVARQSFGWLAAGVTGLVLAVLPAHWAFSYLGALDHHVAVGLASVCILGLAMAWLRRESRRPAPLLAGLLGLALGAPLVIWPGFLLHVGVAELGLLAAVLAADHRERAVARALDLAVAHAVALLFVLPFCLGPVFEQYGPWSPLVLSRFQPAWLGAGAAALAAAAGLFRATAAGRDLSSRAATAVGIGVVGLGGALASAPGLRESLLYASGWFTQADEVRQVQELLPMSSVVAATRYSLAIFVFPFAWLALARQAWREGAADRGFLLWWALVFLVLALLQRRFNNSFSVPYALVWGGAAAVAGPALLQRSAGGRRLALSAGLVLALLAAFVPVASFYTPWVRRSLAAREATGSPLRLLPPRLRVHVGAARWLARSTPATRGYLDPTRRPEYGVLCDWGTGHLTRYLARRPMVQDNFGVYGGRENFERAWAYYAATDESVAVDLLDHLGVRYVVADRAGAGDFRPGAYGPATMTHRLSRLYGSAAVARDPGGRAPVPIPALTRHRMVYHARSTPGPTLRTEAPGWDVAVYERVAGARVVGRAEPGARVEARLLLSTAGGRQELPRATAAHEFRVRARADAEGRYELVLPYSTDEAFSDAVRAMGPYQLRSGSRRASFEVPEVRVRSGGLVEGPVLAAGAAPGISEGRASLAWTR